MMGGNEQYSVLHGFLFVFFLEIFCHRKKKTTTKNSLKSMLQLLRQLELSKRPFQCLSEKHHVVNTIVLKAEPSAYLARLV